MNNNEAPRKNILEQLMEMSQNSNKEADPNYDEVMKNFRVKCPVRKINISIDTPAAIAGMYLLGDENAVDKLKEKADMSDLENGTLLFFTNQHAVELSNFVNGMLYIVEQNKGLSDQQRHRGVYRYLKALTDIPTYLEYSQLCHRLSAVFECDFKVEKLIPLYRKIEDIMLYVSFISYGDLDEFARQGINAFKENIESLKKGVVN